MSDPMSEPMSDPERILRAGLERISQEAETATPLGPRVRAAHRRRTRRTVGASALAVLVVAGGAGLLLHQHGPAPVATSPASQAPAVAGGYRLEVWRDVGVYVPATWGWGGAPGACGVGPRVGADGHRLTGTEVVQGYVGRPIAQASPCSTSAPSGLPYLWLGADLPVGTVDLGGGWVRETRSVAGTTVTVASDDADLRVGILSSAYRIHRIEQAACPASLAAPPTPSSHGGGRFAPVAMTVCAYAPAASGSARYRLLYAEDLPAGPAKQLVDAVAAAEPMGEFSCYGASGGEWALLHLTGGGQSRDYVVDMSCPSITDASGEQHRLTSADVLPWAVDGVNAVLHATPLIDVPGRFIGR